MLVLIALVIVAMIALGALELWLFWGLGERDGRRVGHDWLSANAPRATAQPRGPARVSPGLEHVATRAGRRVRRRFA
jgi:hypothetical protein